MKQMVILAGGLATRLGSLTKNTPKSMVPVLGKPFLEHQIELCKKNGIGEIILCLGHLWGKIFSHFGYGQKFGIHINYSIEKKRLDTGGALKNAFHLLQEEFFVMYGDSYLPTDWRKIEEDFRQSEKAGLMTVFQNNGQIEPSRVLLSTDGKMVAEYNKENPRPEMHFSEYGLNIFQRNLLKKIPEDVFPISRYFDLLIAEKHLTASISPTRFYEMGCLKGLKDLENFLSLKKQKTFF